MSESWTRVPEPPLSRFVSLLWYKEASPVVWRRERLLPMGTVELVVDLSQPDRDPILCGPHNQPFYIDNPGASTVIGVHFRAGGFFPFVRDPAHALRNQVISLREVWGADSDALRDRLHAARTPGQGFDILEAALLARALKGLVGRPEVKFAMAHLSRPQATVSAVASQIGYSRRHFVELFNSEVGLTPKSYARVRRFQRVIALVGLQPEVDWGHLALDAVYFDQAHFANDFRDFSGLTPNRYLAERTPHLNHVPVMD